MRKYLFIAAIVCLACKVQAQIGINTESPMGVLHIDAKGNTSSSTNVSDDVLIDKNGNVGVGTVSPTAKLHIDASGTGLPAMRLSDGTEGLNKVLGSKDANGNMTWIAPPYSWARAYYLTGAKTFPNAKEAFLYSFQVPKAGTYVVVLRWWGRANVTYPIISAYFHIREGTSSAASASASDIHRDGIEYYVKYPTNNAVFSFTTTFRVVMSKDNNWMKIFINPATPMSQSYNWTIGGSGTNRNYNPSILVFKI
uniref:hypothetical protein n=1 Tax=uncultured Dysgonomonas sp. TaxID=206096 RepID=UPI0026343EBC|nr:hypothetical protein [uncultured Dysgonomonas sp.]